MRARPRSILLWRYPNLCPAQHTGGILSIKGTQKLGLTAALRVPKLFLNGCA